MKWRLLLFFLALFLQSPFAQSPQIHTVTLGESLKLSLENSEQIKKARIDRQALEQRLREGRSAALPRINLGVNFDYYPLLPTSLVPGAPFGRSDYLPLQFGMPWQFTTALNIQQPIYDESLRRAAPVANVTRSICDLLIDRSEEEVMYNTALVFYQTLQTQQLLHTVDANAEKLASLQKIAELQLKNGYAMPLDVKRIRVAVTNLNAQRQNLLTNISALNETLHFLCGQPFEAPFDPKESIENPAADSAKWLAIECEADRSIEYKILQRNLELNKVQAGSLRAENFPKLSAYAGGFIQSQLPDANLFNTEGRWYGMAAVGFRFELPVFNGFRRRHKSAQLQLEAQKLAADQRQLLRVKALEFRQGQEQLKNTLNALHNQVENVALAREIAEKMLLTYQAGNAPLTELLNAQTALSEAETNYWQQVFAYKISVVRLLKAAGKMELLTTL
jgi:outer membrane protein TolC